MSNPNTIAINGRFVGKRVTGVERYAKEILGRLEVGYDLLRSDRPRGGAKGHLWEQAVLGARTGQRLLWSPCNTGPLAVRRQVLTLHDMAFVDHPECFSRTFGAWYRWLIPRLVRRVRRVITVSDFSRRRIADECGIPMTDIAVIPNGVDARFRPADAAAIFDVRKRLGLSRDYVLGVGSIEPRKNLRTLLQAWRAVRARLPDVELALAGAANPACFAGQGITETEGNGIRWLGYVNDGDLPPLYSGAAAFVFPSLYEGFGLPPLEAMACGTPVVCSNSSSLPEVVGDAAVLVNPLEPEEMAAAVVRLLSDPSLQRQLSTRGLEQSRRYNWDSAAKATAAVLLDAATSDRN
jgi:glycosyltransferase involved in cell wall biosynthesis